MLPQNYFNFKPTSKSLDNKPFEAFDVVFEDLYNNDGLKKINQKFEEFLSKKNPEIFQIFCDYKMDPVVQRGDNLAREDNLARGDNIRGSDNLCSDVTPSHDGVHAALPKTIETSTLIEIAKILEDFIAELFDIKKENEELKNHHRDLEKIYYIRREFVQRVVSKKFTHSAEGFSGLEALKLLEISFNDIDDLEKKLAQKIFLSLEENKDLEILTLYSAWALYSKEGRALHKNGALFILPQKLDFQNFIDKNFNEENKVNRSGFDLTDQGFSLNRVLAEANYCIFCHKQKKDSCRTGFYEKNNEIKIDPLGVKLNGCPLDQKISEMNLLKAEAFTIASFGMAIIDNPMVAGTGNRICNDCMKSCIYQKQDPVDIPQIETRVVKDVLSLPYGFEIYSLLTRWNPLNIDSPMPKENSNKKILVCGLGPAGYTLSHYLLNEGHQVVAIDGLKIEPLNPEISGVDINGSRQKFKPIKFLDEIYEALSSRVIQGFGGVSEYGITSRWDKNFLTIIRLLLERRQNFRMFGGLRFGSSITNKVAFEKYGFDHIAVCIGAGKPKIIKLENNFAKGIRLASDFLMSLQLNGAYKSDLLTNLQIRMPILVIGGGLTAIDTACEAGAYYIEQIKKFAKKVEKTGKENLWKNLNKEEKNIAEEFLQHHEKLVKSNSNAEFLKNLGGIKILYRKKIQDSPAYRLNHQELNKALQEGIEFIENITPIKANLDQYGHIESLKCENNIFNCRSLLVAAGTVPNLSPFTDDGVQIDSEKMSFFGDVNPKFEGNVVKAMASAKMGYKKISEMVLGLDKIDKIANVGPWTPSFDGVTNGAAIGGAAPLLCHPVERRGPRVPTFFSSDLGGEFFSKINHDFSVKIEKINPLSDHVVEVFIKAPLLANQTEIGHIFRLQNYHNFAKKQDGYLMAMEGVALTALSIDRENGIISAIAIDAGKSSNMIRNFVAGESCIFMGPSGKPTEIAKNETVLLIGGGRGNQPLTAIAKTYTENNCRVIFIAGYKNGSFVVRQEAMENYCEKMIFAIEEKPTLKLNNPQSLQIQGTVIDAIKNYFTANPQKIDRIFTIGNDQMMHEIAKLRHESSIKSISEAPIAITSLNAPMQCMLKGVCFQCLQKRQNGKGEMEYFYSCAEQDQNMDKFDFEHLHARCQQNSLVEKI